MSPDKREIFSVKPYAMLTANGSPLRLPEIRGNQQKEFY